MKRLTFLLLVVLFLGFNVGYSQESDFEKTINDCKDRCSSFNNTSDFCKRIFEKEIFDPKWKFLISPGDGSVYFYNPEIIVKSRNIVEVWVNTIYSERSKRDFIKKSGEKYEKLDNTLVLLKIDCFKRRCQGLESINYASDGSVINISEYEAEWYPILEGETDLRYFQELLVNAHSKTSEIHTHVSTKSLGQIVSPIVTLNLNKGGKR
jgi:hypothetical protein